MMEKVIHGEPSLQIANEHVDAWVTIRGGQMAPVTFRDADAELQPYSLAPWQPGTSDVPVLDVLRGDFFCMPFGPLEDGSIHGAPANKPWSVDSHSAERLDLSIGLDGIPGTVHRSIELRQGQTVVYQRFTVRGVEGDFTYGTHPIIDCRPGVRISTSATQWCSVYPDVFSDPAAGETQILQPGATFTSLEEIPRIDGTTLDMSRYPTAAGHEDLVMLVGDPKAGPIGWSAVSFGTSIWFALKKLSDFPSTLLWISNGGRSATPWNSQHVGRVGVEDVYSYFAAGLTPSREDRLSDRGIPTTRKFSADQDVSMLSIQGVAFAESPLDRITAIHCEGAGRITLEDEHGSTTDCAVDWQEL
jgi:hypothetical protein